MKISEELRDKLIAQCHGSYSHIDLQVLAEDDGVVRKALVIEPGKFIVAEDAYAYSIYYVNYNLTLTKVTYD